ncbi:MAG: tetratricopeptide repeat protein, partial [Pseudomonadota bacterium]|nr:tetratricopeptide repeat protein [Pseudomonadota bacterium]
MKAMNSQPAEWPERLTVNEQGETEWLRLLQHLRWSDHFSLVFIFSNQPQLTDLFRRRIADVYKLRISRLRTERPAQPRDLLQSTLPLLLGSAPWTRTMHAPVWLDLASFQGDDDWIPARKQFYLRLNENRELLRLQARPVVIVMPLDERTTLRELAPDLWAFRDLTVELNQRLILERPQPADSGETRLAGATSLRSELSKDEARVLEEWQRVRDRNDRGVLLAAERAYRICLARGHLQTAVTIANDMVILARARSESQADHPESLRDLSVSLDNTGDIARALGEHESAQRAYAESLEISRRLLERVGETPESLRDLSVSLNKTGDIARALGEHESAQRAY